MNRRTFIKVAIAMAVVAFASFSTVYARQALSENQARGQYSSAQTLVTTSLQRAEAHGLTAAELAPFRSRAGQLSRLSPPSSLPFWSPDTESFYHRQSAAYQALDRQIRAEEARVTRISRSEAASSLRNLATQISTAQTYDLHPNAANRVLEVQTQRLHAATLPNQYQRIAAAARAATGPLAGHLTIRRDIVGTLLQQSQNSRAGVLQHANDQVAAANGQLDLLGLLTSRAATYRSSLSSILSQINGQPTAFGAAVKSAMLEQKVKQISADYNRTVPDKMIVVSTENQSATMYEMGKVVDTTPVTTGGPELPTDHGVFHIYAKISPFEFHSPWGPDSPYYYPPTPVTYWMPFDGAEGLHDASWRSNFGAGSNLQPTDLGTGNYILGTHGCVNLPMDAASFVWNWAPVGTTVVVI